MQFFLWVVKWVWWIDISRGISGSGWGWYLDNASESVISFPVLYSSSKLLGGSHIIILCNLAGVSARFMCMICSRGLWSDYFEVSTILVSMESFTSKYQCIGFMLNVGPSKFSVSSPLLAYTTGASSWRIAVQSPVFDGSTCRVTPLSTSKYLSVAVEDIAYLIILNCFSCEGVQLNCTSFFVSALRGSWRSDGPQMNLLM